MSQFANTAVSGQCSSTTWTRRTGPTSQSEPRSMTGHTGPVTRRTRLRRKVSANEQKRQAVQPAVDRREVLAVLVEAGWDRTVEVGSGITMLSYPSGEWRVQHTCTRPRDGNTLIIAPALQLNAGHSIVSEEPLTVSPSIMCGDCGLHGFVTYGVWRSC